MTVIPLRKPPEPEGYTPLTPQAREAFAALKGRVGALERVFSGSFTSAASHAEIGRLTEEIRAASQLVWRLSR